MPTENINIETQVQVDITRADLQALIAAGTVKKKIYHITDAVGGLLKIGVFSLTTSTTSFNAFNFTQGKFGKYFIVQDIFLPIIEGNGGVVSYNSFAVFPSTGQANTVYIDLSTDEQYYWDGSAYQLLSASTVYEPNLGDFPLTGSDDTLYVATDTGVMYLWNVSAGEYQPLNNTAYIPLAGTVSGSPVTGDIELEDTVNTTPKKIYSTDGAAFETKLLFDEESAVRIEVDNLVTGGQTRHRAASSFIESVFSDGTYYVRIYTTSSGIYSIESDNPSFQGLNYSGDYSANFGIDALISQRVMKSRIWTKAGIWDADDDSTKGFVIGSLIWDTTNSILYRCTSNSTGAATWVTAIKTTLIELIRTGAGVPTSSTRYATEGFAGLSAGIVVTICPNALFTTFKVFITGAQPASGSLTANRNFYNVAGTLISTQTLVIAAGSAAGIYTYSGATVDRTAVDGSYGIELINAATSTSGSVNSIESTYYI